MRIFYAAGRMTNQAVHGSRLWRDNLYLPLIDLGHEVVEFDYDLEPLIGRADFNLPGNLDFINKYRPHAEQELMYQLRAAHSREPVRLFFSYFYSSCARPEVIRQIKGMGITTMNWYCNASYQLDLVREIAPAYDYCLVPEKFRLEDYRRLGAHPIYLQEAANPHVYKPHDVSRDLDVVFVGARYADRPLYLKRLVDAGVSVKVWGPGWNIPPGGKSRARNLKRGLKRLAAHDGWRAGAKYIRRTLLSLPPAGVAPSLPPGVYGGTLCDEEMIRTYSRSKISLGFSTVGETHLGRERITQIRLRDFEAIMCGAFHITEYMPELEEFFEVGKEIICYTDPDDLVEKCKYYLAHEAERERIRQAGRRRAVNDHSWHRRFETVFRQLGLAG